jgi:hypothetical protein
MWRGLEPEVHAEACHSRVAQKVNAACEQGRLDCAGERNTLRPRLRRMHVVPILEALRRTACFMAALRQFSSATSVGHFGAPNELGEAAAFLHTRIASSQQLTPALPTIEGLIRFWRAVLPPLAVAALLAKRTRRIRASSRNENTPAGEVTRLTRPRQQVAP